MPAFFGEFEGAAQLIAAADFPDGAVLAGVVELFFKGDKAPAAGEASPQQFGTAGWLVRRMLLPGYSS